MKRVSRVSRGALITLTLVASSCVANGVPTSVSTTGSATAAPAASPSIAPGVTRSSVNLASGAVVSSDGRHVAYRSGDRIVIGSIFGAIETSTPGLSGDFAWLPDSSGLFVATSAPQRAGPLAILELDGTLTPTELQLANPMLSRDGMTIVAEQQEGCCMNIVQRELRVSGRHGGPARALVTSSLPAAQTQPIALLGIDAQDRVLYRDGDRVALVPLAGGAKIELAIPPGLVPSRLLADSVSPDRSVILLRSFDPTATWMFFEGAIQPFPSEAGPIVRIGEATKGYGRGAIWLGPQRILVRSINNDAASYDLGRYTPGYGSNALDTIGTPGTPGVGIPVDAILAYRDGALLWRSGQRVRVMTLGTGLDRDTGLEVPLTTVVAVGIQNGFLIGAASLTYVVSVPFRP
jgi:hypothetical protein